MPNLPKTFVKKNSDDFFPSCAILCILGSMLSRGGGSELSLTVEEFSDMK